MNPIGRPVVIVAIGQIAAVFLAYCGGLVGEKFWEKAIESNIYHLWPVPRLTYFYAHFGLWLLCVPFAWAVTILVKENTPHSNWPVGFWFLIGVALAAVIGVTGLIPDFAFAVGFRGKS